MTHPTDQPSREKKVPNRIRGWAIFIFFAFVVGVSLWTFSEIYRSVQEAKNATTGRLLVNQVVLKEHWIALDREFPVGELADRFDTEDYQWRVIRAAANDPSGERRAQTKLEEKLLIQWEHGRSWTLTKKEIEKHDAKEKLRLANLPKGDKKTARTIRTREYFATPPHHAFKQDDEYVYYQPAFIGGSNCVVCHRPMNENQDLVQGDLQAIIQIRIPINKH